MSESRSKSDQTTTPDPIRYLRHPVATIGIDDVSRDLRRFDSDDEGYDPTLRNSIDHVGSLYHHNKPSTRKRIDKGVSGSSLSPSEQEDDVDEIVNTFLIDCEKIPDEERKAYRPQTDPKVCQASPQPIARARPQSGEAWPYRETLSFTRSLTFYGAGSITKESFIACARIQEARHLRHKYYGGKGSHLSQDAERLLADVGHVNFRFGNDGVAAVFHSNNPCQNLVTVPNIFEFGKDYHRLVELCSEGAVRSFCFQRLQMLSTSFKMHITINSTVETQEQSNLLGNDFYRTMKIDNHIHAAAAPSAKQFVQFVREKYEKEGDTVVHESGKTLNEVFQQAGLDHDHLTIDAFNVLADYSVYQRFDNFNDKYSPFKLADMRRIFLKTTNHMGGRYFAELLKEVMNRHETSQGHHNTACEMRLSIYGMERHEWYDLAKWMLHDWDSPTIPGPVLSSSNRWLIQIPRLWRIYSAKPVANGQPARSFLEMIENIFVPMFEATLYPEEHPEVAEVLKHIVGLDSVDDEGALEDSSSSTKLPGEWKNSQNPAYWWQLYFIWANLEVLNRLRRARDLNTFSFRPHAGESGDPMVRFNFFFCIVLFICCSIYHLTH